MVKIDRRNIFFEKLKTGINLFLGAGFSTLTSPDGSCLPVASQLCNDICEEFRINKSYSNKLEQLSTILKRNCKEEFQNYLRSRYKVKEYNSLYQTIDKIKISSIITTNIDNLIYLIIDKSKHYYLNNVEYYGAVKRDGKVIEYIPLHGDVLNLESELYFGKFELCNVENKNKGLFSMMESALLREPTIFWGYSFRDGSVNGVLNRVLENGTQDVWVQCMPGSEEINFLKDLGCNVIIGDTESLLKEIDKELSQKQENAKIIEQSDFWKKYEIPTISQVESLPKRDFYVQGKTHWFYALTRTAYVTNNVDEIIEVSFQNKNTLVIGFPFGGKTILLMQVACKIKKPVLYIDNLNVEEAKLICRKAIEENKNYLFLIDNCSEDMNAYRILADCKNIQTIATSDDFMYESSKHILENVAYKKIDIQDLERNEAQRVYSSIPLDLRRKKFVYKVNEGDKYSILELLTANVKDIISQSKIEQILLLTKTQNQEIFELILLTSYLVYNKSALSTSVLFGYLKTSNYDFIKEKVNKMKSYLSELDVTLDQADQDYYLLRSALFAKYTHSVATSKFRSQYKKVIKQFVSEINPCNIYKYYVFKRTAYDAEFFHDVFIDAGDEIYDIIFNRSQDAYILQQWALYKAKTKRFPEAFSYIDKALHMQPKNFSIKNARAIILFEANKNKTTEDAKNCLNEAMEILSECYESDKRKVYHAQKYAEFAIEYTNLHKDTKYIEQAILWLNDLIKNGESMSRKTKNLCNKLQGIQTTI